MMTNRTRRTQAGLPAALLAACIACTAGPAGGAGGSGGSAVRVVGRIPHAEDVSAVVAVGRFLVLGSDEGRSIVVLEPVDGGRGWRPAGAPIPLLAGDVEVDVEGLTARGQTVFVLGSHSLKRPLLKPGASYSENRRRLARIEAERSRDHLFRLELDPETGRLASPVTSIDLRPLLARDGILAPFSRIPGKENGIDLEGLADDGSSLRVGFRTPVLREGWVPVMVLDFDEPASYELRFVELGGHGVRGMCAVSDGYLILSGPPRAGGDAHRVWWWNGRDALPGRGGAGGRLRRLGPVETAGGRPEGIALLAESESAYEVIVVHDGAPNGAPRRYRFHRQAGAVSDGTAPVPSPAR